MPQTEGSVRIPGLKGTVEIVRDRWGVPHIYAGDEDDLFFAQGYVHAQDRLWQMELQRRAGAGRLSEVLGEPTLEIDRHFRTLGLNRAAEAEAAALSGESQRVLEAYAAGVNAYMRQQKGRLSLEFALLRYEPQPWRPVDTLYWSKVMSSNLGSNWSSELVRARLTAKLGADMAADLEPVYPATQPHDGLRRRASGRHAAAAQRLGQSGRARGAATGGRVVGRAGEAPNATRASAGRDPPQRRCEQPVGRRRPAQRHRQTVVGQRYAHAGCHARAVVPGAPGGRTLQRDRNLVSRHARRGRRPQRALRLGADHRLA